MSDTELLNVIAADGREYRRIVEQAVADHLIASITGDDQDVARLQAWIEQCDFLVKRLVHTAKTRKGDLHEAAEAASEAIVGLALNLRELRQDALAAIS